MEPDAYVAYRDQLIARHQHPLTSGLSTAGEVLPLIGVAAAIVRRNGRWASRGLAAGLVLATVAHLFQPGTLKPELKAIFTHPIWATRAEVERNRHLLRVGG